MKITYIKLENVAGIYVGSNKDILEISFEKSKNKIISISATNGKGKSVLLSSLTPFAYVTSLDERSSLPYIRKGHDGYKEIHYIDNGDTYIIKHYYKASKDSHTVKSYFSKNGEELNENGNVRSFLQLVEIHFGLTEEMMRLIRLGSNVNSFITLTPARRKEYIGKLIEEIDMYLKIYKKINDDIRVVKVMLSNNDTNLYNCHITDPVVEEESIKQLEKGINKLESKRDEIVSNISKLQALMSTNNIDDLRRKQQEAQISLDDLERVYNSIINEGLQDATIDSLISKRSSLSEDKINTQAKINSYKISIDNTLRNIERLELMIKKVTSNNDLQSITNAISNLRKILNSTPKSIREFRPFSSNSNDIYQIVNSLNSFNQIGQMIYTLGNKPLEVYIKLRKENKSVDKFISVQLKKNLNRVNENDIKNLLSQVFQDDDIITPNCSSEYIECPYFRLADTIGTLKDKLDEESLDDETLRYIKVISHNIDSILNGIDELKRFDIPDILKNNYEESLILDRLSNKFSLFDISGFQELLTIVRENEVYRDNVEKLKQYEQQLTVYKNSGVDTHINEIKECRDSVEFYKNNIITLQSTILSIQSNLETVDKQIGLVTKYNDGKKYRKILESTIESTTKLLVPLESAEHEKRELDYNLRQINDQIKLYRDQLKDKESKLNEYNRLVKEGKKLAKQNNDLSIIQDTVSTKKGIPVIYMKRYLGKIQKLANDLLSLIYEGDLQLAKFKVTQETFEVPYIKNGMKIPDVKYGSQSEIALVTMALSFALANRVSGTYNILLLDEIDAGLDEDNRSAFLKMLYTQMNTLDAEQVFIISHNLSQMVNVPMDCIRMSEDGTKSKLQNIIYE